MCLPPRRTRIGPVQGLTQPLQPINGVSGDHLNVNINQFPFDRPLQIPLPSAIPHDEPAVVYQYNCLLFLMALAKMDMVSKSVLDIMTVEAPSGLGLAAPSNELALMVGISPQAVAFNWPSQGIDIQPWIMPGAIDTSTDQDLERIAKKG
eukprot:gene2207-2522_t